MGIKKYNPTTPGLRGMTVSTFEEITKSTPEKALTVTLKKHSGRNVRGKITVRHRGGGYRPKYRIIDFKRNKDDVPGKVSAIEYDPNSSANIALIVYADGEKRNIWAALFKTYVSYGFTGLILNNILLVLWISVLHMNKMIAPIINLIINIPINFFLNKIWAFGKK